LYTEIVADTLSPGMIAEALIALTEGLTDITTLPVTKALSIMGASSVNGIRVSLLSFDVIIWINM
jgi:hypothetical protein